MEKKEEDELLQKALALGEAIREIESVDVNAAYGRLLRSRKRKRLRLVFDRLARVAAIFTLPLLAASLTLGYLYWKGQQPDSRYAEVTASAGSVIRYELPDQSVVWLNSGTTLRYPLSFRDDKRSVELTGEAYFEVQANPESPFYVNTPAGLKVYVYGTRFNVSAYEDEAYIGTVLEQGKVNVLMPDERPVVMAPGEQLLYDKQTCSWTLNRVDVSEFVAWKDGKLVFRNAPLDRIFKSLERRFNVEIQLNNHSGKEYKYRATFRDETLEQIMDYLSMSVRLTWKMEPARQQPDGTFTRKKIIVDLY